MKRAVVSICSKQDLDDDSIEVLTPGEFYKKDENFYSVYKETEISGMEGTTTTIKINNNIVTLIREGTTSSNIVFDKKNKNISLYKTPYGTFDLKVKTKNLQVNIDENGGEVIIDYSMEMQGQNPINTKLLINIKTEN